MSGVALSHIVSIADKLYPFEEAEPWDNCGIQIGDPDRPIRSIAFSLDPTPETISFAAEHSCELLITHHPITLEPLQNIRADQFVGRIFLEAARRNVDVMSLHTNFDAARDGLNDALASRLGLTDVRTPLPARCARIGNLADTKRVSELARDVAERLEAPGVRVVCANDGIVRSVFCVSGSGMGYLETALEYEADVIITGDVRYHAAREALEMGISVIDAGHFGMEKYAVSLLAKSFGEQFEHDGLGITCVECPVEKEPFQHESIR